MDEIIQKIIDAEKHAQSVIDVARQEKKSHEGEIQKEIEDYQYKAYQDVWTKIGEYEEEHKSIIAGKVEQIERESQDQMADMIKNAELHKEEWVDHLYRKILDGELG